MNSTSNIVKSLILIVTTAAMGAVIEHYFFKGERTNMFSFSWIMVFTLMMWTTIIPAQLRPSLNSAYFNSHPFEDGGLFYKKFGIDLYRKLLVIIGWEKVIKKVTPIKSDSGSIIKYEATMRWSELAHLVIMVVMLGITVQIGVRYGAVKTLWLNLFNVLFNFYPVILQRYNRPHLQRVISLNNRVKQRSVTSVSV